MTRDMPLLNNNIWKCYAIQLFESFFVSSNTTNKNIDIKNITIIGYKERIAEQYWILFQSNHIYAQIEYYCGIIFRSLK